MCRIFFASALFIALLVLPLIGQAPRRDPAEENPVIEELRKIAKQETVDKFVAATEAFDSRRYADAEPLYLDVLKAAPDFEPALRRLGYVYVGMGKRKEGLELTQRALSKNRSVDNLVGKASTLVSSTSPDYNPSPAEVSEALALAREAWQKSDGKDEGSGALVAETLLMSKQAEEFHKFVPIFAARFKDSPEAAYYSAIAFADEGNFERAEAEIQRGKDLGVPDEAVAPLLLAIEAARDESFFGLGRFRGYVYPAIALVALWALGLVALFIIGRYLSAKTMRSIETSDPNDITGVAQSSLKKFYRRIVSIAGVYYYISQPFVIFIVLAFTAGVVLFFLWVGRIPIYFVIVIVFVGGASIFYMIKSLVTRPKVEDPGRVLTEAEAPRLWQLVRDVAATIKTRPVNEIRLTPGTELAVYERGGFRAKMADQAERILIIGAAVLNDFDQNAFRAVLAHEYGHFTNRDTAGGDIAFRVNADIARVAQAMVDSETNTYHNLSFHFLRLFHFLFRRITHGASRLQEVLADRVAAHYFGPDSFQAGLRHVIRREVEFNLVADKEINAALSASRPFSNIYELNVTDEMEKKQVDEEIQRALDQATTEDDTHPSPRDRFRYVEGARSSELAPPLDGEVWDLFADRAAVKAEMTALIQKLVRPSLAPADSTLGV